MVVTLTSVQPLRHSSSSFSSGNRPSAGLQRTYSRNIQNLEQMAEDLSQGGSDIAEEIRREYEEQKERSRRSSLQSSHQGDVAVGSAGVASGLERMRSRTNSNGIGGSGIVDVNGAARWGGYSPNGFVGSPVGSQRSASGRSHTSAIRKASVASSSRLAQMVEPVQEGRPLDSPLAPSMSVHSVSTTGNEHPRQPSGNSFERQYDQIAGQIEQQLDHVPPCPTKHDEEDEVPDMLLRKPRSQDTFVEAQLAFKDFDGVHFSPATDEFVEVDEHGNEVRRVSARSSSGGMSIQAASMLRAPRTARPMSYAEPPPGDGMVYYPAPVPRMLNLPKRLSQLPSASVQAQRRSQVLGQIAPEARASAPWIPAFEFSNDPSRAGTHRSQESIHQRQASDPISRPDSGHRSQGSATFIQPVSPHAVHPRSALNQRMSMQNLQNLPPQLRASIFFDHQSQPQDVQVKNESAVATLDSILAASATAPVSAFTDHPFAGDVRKSTYAPEFQQKVKNRRSTATLGSVMTTAAEVEADKRAMKARRRSSLGNLLRRNSSAMDLDDLADRRNSRTSSILLGDFNEGGNKLKKRRSQMSLGDEMDRRAEAVRTPGNEISEPDLSSGLISRAQNRRGEQEEEEHEDAYMDDAALSRPATSHSRRVLDDGKQVDEDFKDEEATDEVPDEGGEAMYVQPSTLLAELQVRKAQQKSRNRTAATHYPNGMHSTLLQLDAVEEISRNKRKKTRVPLAWEGAAQTNVEDADDDEDVPLGMLFQGKDGLMSGKRKVGDGKDWDRPLGLMEKRELEDSEPLSSRRNRMLGLPPSFGKAERELQKAAAAGMVGGSQLHLAGQPDADEGDEGDDAGETLADRLRKLKTKDALETAISDTVPKTGERPLSTFTDDVLSQFGPLDAAAGAGSKPGSKPGSRGNDVAAAAVGEERALAGAEVEPEVEAEGETLGQRRARLQRAKDVEARSGLNKLLASNPVGTRAAAKMHVPAQGTLLHSSAVAQAKQRNEILKTNVRSSSYYGLERPLVEAGRPGIGVLGGADRVVSHTGLLGMQGTGGARAPSGGFAGGVYNNGLGGVVSPPPMHTSYSTPGFGMAQGGYFASPTAGMVGYGMPQYQQQGMMNPMAAYQQPMGGYGAGVPGMAAYGYGIPGQYGMAGGMIDEGLDKQKREGIDAWRMSVLH